jgi:hypothetical protein
MFEDFSGMTDLSLDEVVTGAGAVAEAVGRRITTPPGGLFYDSGYNSLDLGSWQSKALTDADVWRLKADMERAIAQEQRLASFAVDVAWYAAGMELRVKVAGTTVDGDTFELVATVDGEGVRLAIALT